MIGDIYDYNKQRIYIMSGEKRIIIPFRDEEEYYYWLENWMSFSAAVIFDYEKKKILKFI
jgi:hypothetical protein